MSGQQDRDPGHGGTPELEGVLADLRRFEPIFHGPEWADADSFDELVAPDFWEVGASGRRYSRDHVRSVVRSRPPRPEAEAGWQTSDFQVRAVGPSSYLLTYTLAQGARITRRLTVWARADGHWSVLFHQGTPIADD